MADYSISLEDDSSGESLGDGLDASALGLSSVLQSGDLSQETEIGSSLDLAGAGVPGGVTDPLSTDEQYNLSGVTDPIASEVFDTGDSESNGAGSAASTHPLTATSTFDASTLFSGAEKFGSSIAQFFFKGASQPGPVIAAPLPYANPNKPIVHGISTPMAVALILGVVVLGGLIASGGSHA